MMRTVLAIAAAGMAFPALAMDDMSCGDFTAMDAEGQAKVVAEMEAMADGGMISSGSMMATTAPTPEETAMNLAAACDRHPEMMLGEVMGMPPE
jgi:hypothetical protein